MRKAIGKTLQQIIDDNRKISKRVEAYLGAGYLTACHVCGSWHGRVDRCPICGAAVKEAY